MDQPERRPFPADEVIVRIYRRLLGFVGGTGLVLLLAQVLPPVVEAWLLASLPMGAFGAICLWARRALLHPRWLTYWLTVGGFAGVVGSIVVTSLARGDVVIALVTAAIWAGPLRALAQPGVRRALSGDDEPRGGLRRRVREARERLAALLEPRLRPVPIPVS